ncbi:MAG: hypothetical protein ACHP78_08730 [Terriglobales bacterium]
MNEPVNSKQHPGAATTMADFRQGAYGWGKKQEFVLNSEQEGFPKWEGLGGVAA